MHRKILIVEDNKDLANLLKIHLQDLEYYADPVFNGNDGLDQDQDTLRRELIANISHDLKTPLATLQCYIETLLIKQEELEKDEKNNILKSP